LTAKLAYTTTIEIARKPKGKNKLSISVKDCPYRSRAALSWLFQTSTEGEETRKIKWMK
jgi:hypothetical protein